MKKLVLLIGLLAVVVSGCGSKKDKTAKTDSDQVLFTAESCNWGCVNNAEDFCAGVKYTVYYNGKTDYYEMYNLSGKKGELGWELSDDEYSKLVTMLEGKYQDYDRDDSACDGTGWKMIYYNEDGEVNHKFSGYIYGNDVLEDIVDLLEMKIE